MTDKPPIDTPAKIDELGRWRVADQIYHRITHQPWNWPVRIALLGGWGEGKTSVTDQVCRVAEGDGHVVVKLSASSPDAVADFWLQLMAGLIDALNERDIPLKDAGLVRAKRLFGNLRAKAAKSGLTKLIGGAGQNLASIVPLLAGAPAIMGLVGDVDAFTAQALFKPSEDDLRRLRENLKQDGEDRRVIVVIDDLDRAEPKLVPEILLALRDVLELANFAFIVPFDDGVLASAIEHHNPAWKDTGRFLEKIFDFQIRLPEPEPWQRQRFVEKMAKERVPFALPVPDMQKYLPASPRKLKALIRHVMLYQSEADRYNLDDEETDWPTVWHLEAMRQTSSTTASDIQRWASDPIRSNKSKIEDAFEDQNIPSFVKKAFEKQKYYTLYPSMTNWPAVRNALICLNQPKILTRGEAEEALAKFTSEAFSDSKKFLQERAERSHWPIDAVASALLDVTLDVYASTMWRLRETEESEARRQLIERQRVRLQLIRNMFSWQPDKDSHPVGTLDHWEKLLTEFRRWSGHEPNEQERELRDSELELALTLLRDSEDPRLFVEKFDHLFSSAPPNTNEEFAQKLACELPSILAPHTLARFSRPDGFATFSPNHGLNSERALLLDPKGPNWDKAADDNAYKRLDAAGNKIWAVKNARQLIVVFAALDEPEKLRPLTAKAKPLAAVWEVATAEHPTPQRQSELLRAREKFIGLEQPEDTLPLPPWAQQPTPQSR